MSFMTLLISTSNAGRALITRPIQSVVLETGELICISGSYEGMGEDTTVA
jgi:tRNA G37 N-methylase TrmD